jgi:hypothetical protein
MKTAIKFGAVALALAFAVPSQATVVISFDGVQTDQNVLFAASTSTPAQTLVAATNQTKTAVTFANTLGLLANASGQSSTTVDENGLMGITTVTIAPGSTFSTALFNVDGVPGNPPPAESTSVLVEALGLGGSVLGFNTLSLDGAGENRIGISGTMGEVFTGFRLTLNPTASYVSSLSQVRLGGVASPTAPVPEPAAWMMMILGFGGIGLAMRKRNATSQARVRFA